MDVAQFCAYDMGVVRGLAYYTGPVFEAFGLSRLRRAICGGGRYDRLLSDLGGPPMAAVGFASSDVVIRELLTELGKLPELKEQADFFVIDAHPSMFDSALEVVGRLRARNVSALFSYNRQGVGKQFKQAATCRVKRVVIVEKGFPETRAVSVKDMATGRQATVAFNSLLADPFREITEST